MICNELSDVVKAANQQYSASSLYGDFGGWKDESNESLNRSFAYINATGLYTKQVLYCADACREEIGKADRLIL